MINFQVVPKKNMLTEAVLYYGQIKQNGVKGIETIASDIEKQSTVSRADILAVLSSLQEVIIATLQNGQGIKLGDVGSFRPTLKSQGVENKDDFNIQNIRKVNIVFTPSSKMRYQLDKKNPFVQFQRVAVPKNEESDEE